MLFFSVFVSYVRLNILGIFQPTFGLDSKPNKKIHSTCDDGNPQSFMWQGNTETHSVQKSGIGKTKSLMLGKPAFIWLKLQ